MAPLTLLIPAAEELGYYGLAERTKRLASRVPDLDIFSQGLVERLNGGWRVTEKGRSVLKFIEDSACLPFGI